MKPENQEKAKKLFQEKDVLKENLSDLLSIIPNEVALFKVIGGYYITSIVNHEDIAIDVKERLIYRVKSRLEQIDKELEEL